MSFKIGDKVKIIKRFPENDSGSGGGKNIGDVGIIVEINEASTCFHPRQFMGNPDYTVWKTRDGNYYGMFIAEELELIDSNNKDDTKV